MAKALTVKSLENLKCSSVRQEVPDGLVRGLYIIVQPSGRASWAVRYRHGNRTRKLTLGTYPALSLKEARDLGSQALLDVAKGGDPAVKHELRNANVSCKRETETVDAVVANFIERYAKTKAARSWQETDRILKREVVARWGNRQLADIRRADVHELLDSVVDRGSPIMANRVLAAFRRMCAWAVERDIIAASPCANIRAPTAERSRDRVLSDDELRQIWQACVAIGFPFGPLVQLLILTGQRRDEVGAMRWSELKLNDQLWVLPKERTKNRREHTVALASVAHEILVSMPRITGRADFVFSTNGAAPVSGFSKAKKSIDAYVERQSGSLMLPWTLHDLRRTFASGCARLGVNLPVIEKVLNHTSGSFRGIVGVYQRHAFEEERRHALEQWTAHLMAVVEESCPPAGG